MSESTSKSLLQRLLVGYLVTAKSTLDDASYEKVQAILPGYLQLANDMVTIEILADKAIVQQAIQALAAGNTVEETLMYTYMLYIYLLTHKSTGHPLEMGIIRQKIIGLLPRFENAAALGLLREDIYSSNAALLMSIADKTEQMAEALDTLAAGYAKYST